LVLTLFVLATSLSASLPWQVLGGFLPLAGFLLLVLSYLANIFENRELQAGLASLKESAEELLDQAGVNYNNALMVNEVGQAISKQAGIDEVLHHVIKALEVRLTYDRGLILLADPEKARLQFRIGFGYSEEQLSFLVDTSFSLTNPESREAFIVCFREQKPILINDFSDASVYHSTLSL